MYARVSDINNDFDLLRGSARQCDNQNTEHSGMSLISSHDAAPSLSSSFLVGNNSEHMRGATLNSDSVQEGSFRHSHSRHSLGAHASATCSAGMLPPIHSNPFDTGLLNTTSGLPLQGGGPGFTDIEGGNNTNMLDCNATPGIQARQGAPEPSDHQPVLKKSATSSMPQVLPSPCCVLLAKVPFLLLF